VYTAQFWGRMFSRSTSSRGRIRTEVKGDCVVLGRIPAGFDEAWAKEPEVILWRSGHSGELDLRGGDDDLGETILVETGHRLFFSSRVNRNSSLDKGGLTNRDLSSQGVATLGCRQVILGITTLRSRTTAGEVCLLPVDTPLAVRTLEARHLVRKALVFLPRLNLLRRCVSRSLNIDELPIQHRWGYAMVRLNLNLQTTSCRGRTFRLCGLETRLPCLSGQVRGAGNGISKTLRALMQNRQVVRLSWLHLHPWRPLCGGNTEVSTLAKGSELGRIPSGVARRTASWTSFGDTAYPGAAGSLDDSLGDTTLLHHHMRIARLVTATSLGWSPSQ